MNLGVMVEKFVDRLNRAHAGKVVVSAEHDGVWSIKATVFDDPCCPLCGHVLGKELRVEDTRKSVALEPVVIAICQDCSKRMMSLSRT